MPQVPPRLAIPYLPRKNGSIEEYLTQLDMYLAELDKFLQGAFLDLHHDLVRLESSGVSEAPYGGISLSRTEANTDYNRWLPVGPNGSKADVIWGALDFVPKGARAVRLNCVARATHGSGAAGAHNIQLQLRRFRSIVTPDSVVIAAANLTNEVSWDRNTVDVLLDAERMFEFRWSRTVVSGGTLYVAMWVAGWLM